VPPLQGGSRGFDSLIAHPHKPLFHDRGFVLASVPQVVRHIPWYKKRGYSFGGYNPRIRNIYWPFTLIFVVRYCYGFNAYIYVMPVPAYTIQYIGTLYHPSNLS